MEAPASRRAAGRPDVFLSNDLALRHAVQRAYGFDHLPNGSDLNGRTSSEVVAELLPGARVVKVANTLGAPVLAADPHESGGQRVIFLSGDDADAKSEVVQLFEDAGFFAVDLGELVAGGRMQQIGGPLAGLNLIRLP